MEVLIHNITTINSQYKETFIKICQVSNNPILKNIYNSNNNILNKN